MKTCIGLQLYQLITNLSKNIAENVAACKVLRRMRVDFLIS